MPEKRRPSVDGIREERSVVTPADAGRGLVSTRDTTRRRDVGLNVRGTAGPRWAAERESGGRALRLPLVLVSLGGDRANGSSHEATRCNRDP